MKEKINILYEEESNSRYPSSYVLVDQIPKELKKGWVAKELEVERSENPKHYVIRDEDDVDFYGLVKVRLSKESVKKVIEVVKQFDGYNTTILIDVLNQIEKSEEVQKNIDGVVYF